MKTWTINNFDGFYPVGTAAVVSADDVYIAITLLEEQLEDMGLKQTIKPEQLIPMPTRSRKLRILCNGNY